jgi:hypothetical protein
MEKERRTEGIFARSPNKQAAPDGVKENDLKDGYGTQMQPRHK